MKGKRKGALSTNGSKDQQSKFRKLTSSLNMLLLRRPVKTKTAKTLMSRF